MHIHTACRQQIADGLIPLQSAMNKTYVDMHIKKQELVKKYAAKQGGWGFKWRSME